MRRYFRRICNPTDWRSDGDRLSRRGGTALGGDRPGRLDGRVLVESLGCWDRPEKGSSEGLELSFSLGPAIGAAEGGKRGDSEGAETVDSTVG